MHLELEALNKKKQEVYQNYLKSQVDSGINEYAEAVQTKTLA